MLSKTKAIVLHYVKYGSSSIIVTLYSENFGRLTCIANAVRTRKTRMHASFFQPLTLVELDLYYRQNREIHRIKDIAGFSQYSSIPFDIRKQTIAFFIAEVLYRTLPEEESNKALFEFLTNALICFDEQPDGINDFHLWLLMQLTRYLGIFPRINQVDKLNTETENHFFNNLSDEIYPYIRDLTGDAYTPPLHLKIPGKIRALLLDKIIHYYSLHIEGFSVIKSYPVLMEIFR